MNENPTITKTTLEGVFQILRPTFPDDRGFFRESIRTKELEAMSGIPFNIVQANHARSTKSTLRGIHIAPWNKLIYVTRGRVQAVIVDLKKDSPTFGQHQSFILGDENRASIFVPAYCGNSYLVLSDEADYTYLTDQEWTPGRETSVAWDDPKLAIKWEYEGEPTLSERDKANPTMKELYPEF